MRRNRIAVVATLLLATMMAGSSWAEEQASVEMGKKLFSDTSLGAVGNTKTCSTCHPDGKGLGKAGKMENLRDMINNCIVGALKGKELDVNGPRIESLLLYVKSLEKK